MGPTYSRPDAEHRARSISPRQRAALAACVFAVAGLSMGCSSRHGAACASHVNHSLPTLRASLDERNYGGEAVPFDAKVGEVIAFTSRFTDGYSAAKPALAGTNSEAIVCEVSTSISSGVRTTLLVGKRAGVASIVVPRRADTHLAVDVLTATLKIS